MFKIFNENYYIDIDAVDNYVQLNVEVPNEKQSEDQDDDNDVTTLNEEKQIHLVKYELVKVLLETVLTEVDQVDEKLGMNATELTIPFKIAFNSLLMKSIINKL
jgi:hypothetical protein